MLEQAKELSLPGLVLVMASKMLLDVIDKLMKKNKSKPSLKDELSPNTLHDMRIDAVLANLTENMVRQTTILERMSQDHSDLAKVMIKIDAKLDALTDNSRKLRN